MFDAVCDVVAGVKKKIAVARKTKKYVGSCFVLFLFGFVFFMCRLSHRRSKQKTFFFFSQRPARWIRCLMSLLEVIKQGRYWQERPSPFNVVGWIDASHCLYSLKKQQKKQKQGIVLSVSEGLGAWGVTRFTSLDVNNQMRYLKKKKKKSKVYCVVPCA